MGATPYTGCWWSTTIQIGLSVNHTPEYLGEEALTTASGRMFQSRTVRGKRIKVLVTWWWWDVANKPENFLLAWVQDANYLSSTSSQYPLLICCHSLSPVNHFQIAHLDIHHLFFEINRPDSFRQPHQSCLDSPPRSPTCQPISLIIPALIIHYSFSLSRQAQNQPLQQILPTLDFFYQLDCLIDNGTGPDPLAETIQWMPSHISVVHNPKILSVNISLNCHFTIANTAWAFLADCMHCSDGFKSLVTQTPRSFSIDVLSYYHLP